MSKFELMLGQKYFRVLIWRLGVKDWQTTEGSKSRYTGTFNSTKIINKISNFINLTMFI
jgi:hypothetical protein